MKTGTPKSRNRPAPPVVAPSEEVFSDLPKDQKDKLIEQAIETASYVLLFSMKCVKVENYITGTIDNNGHTYELSFRKIEKVLE